MKFKPTFLSSWAFKFSASLFAYAASQAGRHLNLMKYAQAFQNPNNYLCKSCNNSAPLSVTKFRNQSNWSTWNNWIDDSTRRRRRRRGSSAPQRDLTSSLRQPKRLHPLVKCLGFNQGGCLPSPPHLFVAGRVISYICVFLYLGARSTASASSASSAAPLLVERNSLGLPPPACHLQNRNVSGLSSSTRINGRLSVYAWHSFFFQQRPWLSASEIIFHCWELVASARATRKCDSSCTLDEVIIPRL